MSKIQLIKFKVGNTPLFAKKLNANETLFNIRKKLGDKLPNGCIFVFADGTEIDPEDEKEFTLEEIIQKVDNAFVLHLNIKDIKKHKEKNEIKAEKPKKDMIEEEKENAEDNENEEDNQGDLEEEEGEEDNEISDLSDVPSWLQEESKDDNDDDYFEQNYNKQNQNKKKNKQKNNKCKNYEPANPYFDPKQKFIKHNHKNNPNSFKIIINKLTLREKDGNLNEPPAINIKNKKNKKQEENIQNIPKFKKSDLSKFKLIEKKGKLNIYFYPSAYFTEMEEIQALSFMVVGETGCGKTTLLNSFINSLLGVELQDDFRFKIISENFERSQAFSQTSNVNYYNIRSVGGYPPVKIIDTPGFGDTRGIKRDKEITAQIKKLFNEEISTLNAVCFVTKSSNNRLSHSQKYILSSILDLFGEDVKEIFVFMLTFCDGGKPNVIEPLIEKDCPFSQIIKSYKDTNWYYKFNNSAIFEDNRDDEFTKMFWKIGMKNFIDFKEKLKILPRKSLSLSKAVLAQRKYLEDKVQILSNKLKVGLNKMEEIKGIMKIVLNLRGDLKDSKNFTKKIMQPAIKKIPKLPNYYATTCTICTKTCHKECRIADDDNKKNCSAMDKNGYCESCPKKCLWSDHKNRDYILEDIMEEKTITLEELKKRYNFSKGQLSMKKQLFLGAREELIKLNIELLETQENINNSINLLHEIALNKSVFESAEQHLDLLIEVEQSEHKPGWQSRIQYLYLLKEEKRILRECYQGKNQKMNDLRKFVEEEINKYCDIDIEKLENDEIKDDKDKCCIF